MKLDHDKLNELVELAVSIGASAAQALPVSEVSADDQLAALCSETRCQNYGLSPTCPPHVEGPKWLREYLNGIDQAIFLKIDLPTEIMYSDQRREVGKLLHFIVIELEKAAIEMGLTKAMGFAGGSCKNLLCADKPHCNVLYGDGECRNPDRARPSLSGFGINVNRLMKAAGWSPTAPNSGAKSGVSTRYGLVLVG
jgi:predicted metal-binding protein